MTPLQLLVALALAVPLAASRQSGRPPNYLVFLADDLGYGDIGCYGAPTISTPNIDNLARQGLVLKQYYAAASVCSPSRAGFMTGRQPVRTGIYTDVFDDKLRVLFPFSTGGLARTDSTLASMLKRGANYSTFLVGKWHLGHLPEFLPSRHGFDHFFGLPYSHDMSSETYGVQDVPIVNRVLPPIPLFQDEAPIEQPVDFETLPTRLVGAAVDYLVQRAEHPDQPFFLMVAFYQPHVPVIPSAAYRNTSLRGQYGDFVTEMDAMLGQIMDALYMLGLQNNTLVHFASDNGPWAIEGQAGGSTAGFRGSKGQTFEGGMRVPAIFSWPGVIAPGTSFAVTSGLDTYRTFAELSGITVSVFDAEDSMSMACVLLGSCPQSIHRRAIYYYYEKVLMAVRNGPYKLHFYTCGADCMGDPTKHNPPLLYNVEQDPFEAHPLNTSLYTGVVTELKAFAEAEQLLVRPGQSQEDRFGLLAGPCCNPFPLARPCHGGCSNGSNAATTTCSIDSNVNGHTLQHALKAAPDFDIKEALLRLAERVHDCHFEQDP